MTAAEYEKAIRNALSETQQTDDPISIVRKILNNCDAEFPYGDCRGILAELSENDFTQWKSCTYEEAEKFADEGVPAVGVSNERVIVIAPEDGEKYKSEFVSQANSLTPDEFANLKFFAYSEPFAEKAFDYGSTSDVPNTLEADGFAGWYIPASGNMGVTSKVARFAQKGWGPCKLYAILMGYYYLKEKDSNPDAAAWFNNNVSKYRDPNGGSNDKANGLIEEISYNLDEIKTQLNNNKPVTIAGKDKNNDTHFALIVAYVGCGANTSQFVVIDPWFTNPFPTTLMNFRATYNKEVNIGKFK